MTSKKLQSIDKKLLSELIQTGNFRPFLFDIFFNLKPLNEEQTDCVLVFLNDGIFYIREEEVVDILKNTDLPELTSGSYLLIITTDEDVSSTDYQLEKNIQQTLLQYLEENAIAYKSMEVPTTKKLPFEVYTIYKIKIETI